MRLIDADKLIIDLTYDWTGRPLHGNRKTNYANIRAEILAQPTVDAASVVRCKDCIYWDDDRRCESIENGLVMEYTTGLDYCSYGKRKEKNNV